MTWELFTFKQFNNVAVVIKSDGTGTNLVQHRPSLCKSNLVGVGGTFGVPAICRDLLRQWVGLYPSQTHSVMMIDSVEKLTQYF